MGICYVKIVDNELKGLKIWREKKIKNDFEKSLHFGNLEKFTF